MYQRNCSCLIVSGLLISALLGGGVTGLPNPAHGEEPGQGAAVKAAAALYEGVRTATLPNGLRIYLKPIPGSPVVTTMVAYKVGSADEDLDHTGLAHYLEHLMFKGTEKLMPGDIDHITLLNGGANNASTSEDYTMYYFDFAADRWEVALQIEADRMRNLRIDARHEFEQEKGAVTAELERDEDEPFDLETKAILPLLFDHNPYGHPVIGERDHVRGATAQVIKSFYDQWYYPNNAALVITGGFDPDQALARIKELFGPLPRGNLPPRKTAVPIHRDQPVHKEIPSKFEVPRMLMGFNGVATGTPDFYPLEVVQGILSVGKTGRLYKKLVEQEAIASMVDTTNFAGRYPGWFAIQMELLKGKDRKQAEKLVLAEIEQLRDKPVSPDELQRVQRNLLAGAIFGRESVHALADSIARGVTTNDLDFLRTYLSRIQAVTARDVQEAARKYLDPERRVVVWSVPAEADGGGGAATPNADKQRLRPRTANSEPSTFSLEKARRVQLPNGLILLLLEDHRLPIIVADASVRWVTLLEPEDKAGVATLTGMLLDEGTTRHSGPEIAELIESVGGSLSLSATGGTVKLLTPDRDLGLGLLFECLAHANFPKEAFLRKQAQLLSAIADMERRPDEKALLLYRNLAYGKHSYGRPNLGRRETVKALRPEDCQAFHRKVFVPDNTIVALVGDFNSQAIIDQVTRLTADWKSAPVERPQTPAVEMPKRFEERIISMPAAAQLHFYMGHPGIRRNNPDYYKLLVMDYVLGTGPGFTDRLSARLRDREGLGYTVSASITPSAGEEPGLFTCYIGTVPDALPKVKRIFLEELQRIRHEKPSREEVEDAKKYLLGNLPFKFTTGDRVAGQLLSIERYDLGFNYLDKYRKAVAAVTPDDVQAVARKYIDPQHMILVVAGAVDQQGRPLHALPPPKK
jgi:zinc protease